MPYSKTCRRKQFELTLNIENDTLLNTTDPSQKNWIVSRAMEELADDLIHLDNVSKRFVNGSKRDKILEDWAKSQAKYNDSELVIDSQQVMQEWERPYMEAMAETVTQTHGDILEIGFGMGISASYIQSMGIKSYTVIECNEGVKAKFEDWKKKYPGKNIRMVFGHWQDVITNLGQFDGIFFDTYPLSEEEFTKYVIEDITFANHFFQTAANHLKKGGIFTYYSNEIDSVARRHQRSLFKYFTNISFHVCRDLFPPDDCNYWWADSMVVVQATK